MTTSLPDQELAAVAVFPLPGVVMFPGTRLPLHLFEPRYRAMVEHCMTAGQHVLAVAQLKPGWEPNYEGRPPIHEIAGIGRIVSHQPRTDGTHDIVVQALARARLHELESTYPFRLARAELLPDAATDDVSTTDVTSLISLASEVGALLRRAQPEFELGLTGDESPALLADRLAHRCIVDATVRQHVLDTVAVPARVRLVTSALAELHLSLARRSGRPSAC